MVRLLDALARHFNSARLRREYPQVANMLTLTDALVEELSNYAGKELSINWCDGDATPYAACAYIVLYARGEDVRQGPVNSLYLAERSPSIVVALDYKRNPGHIAEVERMAPTLRRTGAQEIIYITLNPQEKTILNGSGT